MENDSTRAGQLQTRRYRPSRGWLVRIDRSGRAFGHTAKSACTGADVAENHERGRFARIALHAIGASRMVADRLKSQLVDQPGSKVVGIAFGDVAFQPARQLAGPGFGCRVGVHVGTVVVRSEVVNHSETICTMGLRARRIQGEFDFSTGSEAHRTH